jgi:electron transfer DM13
MLTHLSARSSTRRFPLWLRFALVPLVAGVVLVGIWVTGGVLTNNFRLSMLFTTLWLGAVGLATVAVAWRWRPLALPVLGTALVTATAVGGYLLYASSVDKVVNEEVAVAQSGPPPRTETTADTNEPPAARMNTALGSGGFESGEHATRGKATVIRLAEGGTVLTLTDFETSPGPDLRVYLASGGPEDLGDVVDLGALKGNKGNQQYDVPASADLNRHRTVVIWCRAFSVAFGSARLA